MKRYGKPLSAEDLKVVHRLANDIWQTIGYDCLSAVAEVGEDKPRPVNSVTMTTDEVVEVVIDADRMREAIRRERDVSPQVREFAEKADYDELTEAVRGAFAGFDRWGL